MSRTLAGINAGGEGLIDIPSIPESIRIGGELGPRGFLVGVDNASGNVSWVQASTPFIPPNSIIGADLNENIGFTTTASETGGVITIHNATNTATLNVDRLIAGDLTLDNDIEADTIQAKTKFIAQAGLEATRKILLDSANGNIEIYSTHPTTIWSVLNGVNTTQGIDCRGSIIMNYTGATQFLIQSNTIPPVLRYNIQADTGVITHIGNYTQTGNINNTGNITSSGTITSDTNTTDHIIFKDDVKGKHTKDAVEKEVFFLELSDAGSTLTIKDYDTTSNQIILEPTGRITCKNLEVEENVSITGNTAIQGNLQVDGNFNYDGDLQFNDLIFDGFYSQRTDDADATTEQIRASTLLAGINAGGGKIEVKHQVGGGVNTIQESIVLDGINQKITSPNAEITNLTATNFTFDNNLTAKEITGDKLTLVNNADANTPTIILDGGVNPAFPTFPAGSMVIGGSLNQLTPSSGADETPNKLNGGVEIGPSAFPNANTLLKVNGKLTIDGGQARVNNGLIVDGEVGQNLVCSRPFISTFTNNTPNEFCNIQINGSNRGIKFNNTNQFLEGFSNSQPTICRNLDISDISNATGGERSIYTCLNSVNALTRRFSNSTPPAWTPVAKNLLIIFTPPTTATSTTGYTLDFTFYGFINDTANVYFQPWDPRFDCVNQPVQYKRARMKYHGFTGTGLENTREQQHYVRMNIQGLTQGAEFQMSVATQVIVQQATAGASMDMFVGGQIDPIPAVKNPCNLGQEGSTGASSLVFPGLTLTLSLQNGEQLNNNPQQPNGDDWVEYT